MNCTVKNQNQIQNPKQTHKKTQITNSKPQEKNPCKNPEKTLATPPSPTSKQQLSPARNSQPTISCSSYMPIKAFYTLEHKLWGGALCFE